MLVTHAKEVLFTRRNQESQFEKDETRAKCDRVLQAKMHLRRECTFIYVRRLQSRRGKTCTKNLHCCFIALESACSRTPTQLFTPTFILFFFRRNFSPKSDYQTLFIAARKNHGTIE